MKGNSTGYHGVLDDFLDETVYPALHGHLDQAFPEFDWKKHDRAWVATRWPEEFPLGVTHERPERLMVYDDGPGFIMVHGHHGVSWTQYLAGGRTPRGGEFIDIVSDLVCFMAARSGGRSDRRK